LYREEKNMGSDIESVEKRVFAWIDEHKDDIIKFCMDYIRYKSPTGKELEVQRDFIKPFFEKAMKEDNSPYLVLHTIIDFQQVPFSSRIKR